MKKLLTLLTVLCCAFAKAQLLTWSPVFITEASTTIDITVDASKGNAGLLNYANTADVFLHIGAITSSSTTASDWKYSKFAWATSPAAGKATFLGNNKWKYTITGGLRTFFGLTNPSEKILKIAILFRNGAGTTVQRNTDGSDMFVPVYPSGLAIRIDQPFREPKYNLPTEPITKTIGDNLIVVARTSETAAIKLFLNGVSIGSLSAATSITRSATIVNYGDQLIVAEASTTSGTKYDTVRFFVTPPQTIAPLPAGVKPGINYEPGDTSVTLVLFAPHKKRAALIGDFTNWLETSNYQMKRTPDSNYYWIRVTGLTPGVEYAFQYIIDGSIKVADIYCEKILDPWNDQYIPAANYPNLKPYPTGKTSNIVGILQTRKAAYNWQIQNFVKPDKRNLVIYEMLIRDFVATQRWETIKDTLAYFRRLGINAIQVMPFNEFEGNNSWGYNPDFYFAPDKMYGPEDKLREFVDECHKNGIAVIMDIALNHAFGLSPTVQMYWDGALNKPSTNSPYHNPDAKHPFNVGYDFNHESPATKVLVDRVIEHWLVKYKIDGFRWDLSKGFTQVNSGSDVGAWGNYDASRVSTWKRLADKMQAVAPKSYCILEHFAANNEEIELSNYGMLLWGNTNHSFNEATMGYVSTSNFSSGIHTSRGWSQPHLITYMESHDEERLMYRNLQFGNTSGSYSTKDLNTALKRMEMATAFFAAIPGPKMIWQFGELGFDLSINRCEDGTVNQNCRLSNKPPKWDYQNNSNRLALRSVYSKMFRLRHVPNFLSTFTTGTIIHNLSGAFKTLEVNSDSLKIVVFGNFGVTSTSGSVSFPRSGVWYNYLTGASITLPSVSLNITLLPGEYYVYVSRPDVITKVNALPLKLISFNAKRTAVDILLNWNTENEENVKSFIVERSFNGTEFGNIGTVAAKNIAKADYRFSDADAVFSNQVIYYRLKMLDIDGKFSYSPVVIVNPIKKSSGMTIFPNPVKGRQLNLKMNESVQYLKLKVQDLSGRTIKTYNYPNGIMGTVGSIPLGDLSNGVYIINAETNVGTFNQQIIVQNNK